MHKILAFMRRDWLVAASYRTGMLFSVIGLLVVVVPVYFISGALQPVAGKSISGEGRDFFAFLIAGMATYQFVATGLGTVPTALASGLRTGTFEFQLTTPGRLHTILGGMLAYPFVWTMVRAVVLVVAAAFLGAQFGLDRLLFAVGIWGLITLAYLPFGLISCALILVARTPGPIPNAVLAVSTLLGGVYYPTNVIPSWLGEVSTVVPLTYGLRAFRRVMIDGSPLAQVRADLEILLLLTAGLMAISLAALAWAFRYARRTGNLAQY